MWHPLTTMNHMLDYQLFGLNPRGHHLVSVAIHIVNALLLFWILNNLTGVIWASAFVAAVFALHPLQVESVAWTAERKTVLSGLFWLLTIVAYIRYARKPGFGRYMLLLFVFGLCIMTKPVVVTLPLALLLLDYWPLERIGKQKTDDRERKTKCAFQKVSVVRLIVEKLPLLAMSAILAVITLIAQQSGGAVRTLEKAPLDYRVANMFVSYIRYIGKMLWPSQLAVFYTHPQSSLSKTIALICVLLFILISFGVYAGRRRRYIVMGWLWFVGTLVPMIGLVQAGEQAMANRYMYISMCGLLIITAWGLRDLVASRPRLKVATAISTMFVLSAMVIITQMQVRHWQNSLTLFEYTLNVTGDNPAAENGYGCALLDAGKLDDAIFHLNKALSLAPKFTEAKANLGIVYLKQNKFNEAVACFNESLQQNKNSAKVHFYLAFALNMQKKYAEAIKNLAKVLEIDSNYPDARSKMAITLIMAGRPDEANKYLNKGLNQEIYASLGSEYIQVGEYDLAIQNLTKAIELKPGNIDVLNKLAWLFAAVDNTSIHNAQKAVEFAQQGCELTGYKDPILLDTLAVAYAAAGRFDEAKATAEKALNIAKKTGRENLAIAIQKRIKLYEAGQPYRQK